MKISALEEYGLRCMLSLAQCKDKETLTLPEVSEREGLSIAYTGKLLMLLRQANLVRAERGRNGGYALTKSPEDISLQEVFTAIGEPLYSSSHCAKHSGNQDKCVHTDDCNVRDVWLTLSRFISDFLENITLADLTSRNLGDRFVWKNFELQQDRKS
ncbi:MAG: Rrf2 family transcriptional regulator [Candidatus Electryonea clarkiae]|nr:Rrf2 family transcriptional regulator [Candidatus Electryonea clarkiae]MDP8285313.1 Rrf2 family transcriptional regulator [Candidatus Electryonea clarkiae]